MQLLIVSMACNRLAVSFLCSDYCIVLFRVFCFQARRGCLNYCLPIICRKVKAKCLCQVPKGTDALQVVIMGRWTIYNEAGSRPGLSGAFFRI